MEDYYGILGINASASATDIRIAYKRMAMQYHPDRNAGDREAEEMFKRVNEAYRVLSDPLRKSRYDHRMNPAPSSEEVFQDYRHETNRRKYWQWQQAQKKHYKLDREYFRIQGLAFLVFLVIAGFAFAVVHTAYYVSEQKRLARSRENVASLRRVDSLFTLGNYDQAFTLMMSLKQKDPYEFRFLLAHDSLKTTLRDMAEASYRQKQFAEAVTYFIALKNYEEPVRFETLEGIALSQYYLGNFAEALEALKYLHNQQPENIQLIYNIAIVNLDKLAQPSEALPYLDKGKDLFKKNLSDTYGEAFMIVMDGRRAPDIYYQLFEARARANLLLKRYDDVRSDCNWAVYLRPQRSEPYKLRALANIDDGAMENVCADLKQAQKLGANDVQPLRNKHCR